MAINDDYYPYAYVQCDDHYHTFFHRDAGKPWSFSSEYSYVGRKYNIYHQYHADAKTNIIWGDFNHPSELIFDHYIPFNKLTEENIKKLAILL